MRKASKIIGLYAAAFVLIFTINGALSMDSEHGFFYLTPTKLTIRLITAGLITVQIYTRFSKHFK